MPKQIIIAEQHRIAAVFSEDQIQELIVATGNHQVGDIYLGTVENVLPGIDAAFVNIGDPERNGFIHVSDLGPLRLKRTSGAITELLTPQQKVLVQVMKEPTGNKGPRLTGNITLPGRYLVLMPFGRGVNLSRRIKSENERNRLRALAILLKPAGMGLLVRTEAENRPEEAIIEDLEALQKQWEAIQQEAVATRAPALLNRDDDFVQRVLRDMYSEDVNRIVVDSHTGVKRVKQHLMNWSAGKAPQGVLIDHHRDRLSILDYFRVNAAIREALKPRVDLPSGGYIIIEPTEALTVIDVNSGSFTRSATARETVLWTNCEAATEIARQLRLRNLAGVIIVDFIDMDSRRDQLQVLEHFNKALKADKARPQIAQLSELGLVELTRKRQGQNIYELFGRLCPTCGGLGHVVHLPGESGTRERESVVIPPRETVQTTVARNSFPGVEEAPEYPGTSYRVTLPTETSRPVLPSPTPKSEPPAREVPVRDNYWDTEAYGDDLAPEGDLPDLDLLNHPNYQERGLGANARRRRRRRIGLGDEEPARPSSGFISPSSSPGGIGESGKWLNEPEMPTSARPYSERTAKGLRLDPDRTNRPIKPETTPPEIISVEMSPEEQQVYAFMGVSPLVRLNRQVKNPKSSTVIVKLPGQADEDALLETSQPNAEAINRIPTEIEEERRVPNYSGDDDDSDRDSEDQDIYTGDISLEADRVPETATETENGDLSMRRRRRRRSSAVESDGNQ